MSKDDDMPTTFPEKWAKVLKKIPEFQGIADSADTDELKKIVMRCEGNIYTIEKEREKDTKLNAAKELVKEFSEPYAESLKFQTAKVKYAMFLLEGRGVNLDNKDVV